MTKHLSLTTAAFVLSALPAAADLTAAQVWESWQSLAETTGQAVAAESESMSGNTLTLGGTTVTMQLEEGQLVATLGEVQFTERGDGSVGISLPLEYPIVVRGQNTLGETYEIELTVAQTALDMVASGSPEDVLYTYSADRLAVSADGAQMDGEVFPLDIDISFMGLGGEYQVVAGAPNQIRNDLSAAGVAMAFAASDPEGEEGDVRILATMSDLVSTSSGTISSLSAMSGLGAMVEQGLRSTGSISFANARYEIAASDPEQEFELVAGSATSTLDVTIDANGLSYGGGSTDIAVSVTSPQVPLPDLSMAMESSQWEFAMPIAVSEEPQDFTLVTRLSGLTVSDMLWSMIDPGGALPRDPAALVIDLAGKANWLIDITDPALDETQLEAAPGQIHALTLNELKLSLAGAELTGTGDVTFDNSGGPQVPPVPEGAVDLQLIGGNGLIDKLVTMGMVPQDQAMGARMMLGLFARPGEGEDTLQSTIEFTPDGGIVANGQKLR